MTGWTRGSCAPFTGVDLVGPRTDADEICFANTLVRAWPPVKSISKVILTESGFFSQKLCKQIVDNLFKYTGRCILGFAYKCVTVAYM